MNFEQLNLESLKRVSVVGTSCSGKTTFARNLANILKTKHVQLDAINFLPGWIERPNEEFLDLVGKAAAEEVWVFDGNYTRTREIVWGRATMIVWLNYSFSRTFYRSLNRTVRRVFSREELYSGNRESFQRAFMSRESMVFWVLKSYHEKRRRYMKLLLEHKPSRKEIFVFEHPKQAEEFLRQVRQTKT